MKCWILLSLVGSVLGTRVFQDFPVTDGPESFQYFQGWQARHGKVYATQAEYSARYTTFVNNMKKAAILNARRSSSDAARFGPTQFADLTETEFEQTILMNYKAMDKTTGKQYRFNLTTKAPSSYDWTEKSGVVTPIKNQGSVGTCWAFAGLANVESLYAIKSGSQCPDLSPESLNDCDGYSNIFEGAVACGPLGATMPGFYIWVIQEGGVMSEKDYPYCVGTKSCSPCQPDDYNFELCGGDWPIDPCKEEDSCKAKYDKSKFVPGVKVKDYGFLSSDEDKLAEGLVSIGPLVAGIDATDLQLYSGGILEPNKCNPRQLNHAVLLVGYGTSGGGSEFWRSKNSWGIGWGEDGFFRIQRGTGACGINADVSSVILE